MDKILPFTALFGASAAFSRIVEQQTACKAGDMQACTAAGEYFHKMAHTGAHYKKAKQVHKSSMTKIPTKQTASWARFIQKAERKNRHRKSKSF